MTFTQLKAEVRRRLNESAANFWADADVATAINDGYAEMSDASEWYETNTSIAVTAGTNYYVPDTVTSAEFLSPIACQNPTTKVWLEHTDPLTLDSEFYPQWGSVRGQPEFMFMRGLFNIGVVPSPSANGNLTLYYTRMPAALSSGSDVPGFDQEFHFGIVEYALYDLLVQEGEVAKAMTHWNQYVKYENDLVTMVRKRGEIPRVRSLNG